VPAYTVNKDAVRHAKQLIDARQYVLRSRWQDVQPRAREQNAFLKEHSWEEYAAWYLGLTEGADEEAKARYAFVYGDFRRLHRMGLIACHYRAAEWRHKEIELAAHELLPLGVGCCSGGGFLLPPESTAARLARCAIRAPFDCPITSPCSVPLSSHEAAESNEPNERNDDANTRLQTTATMMPTITRIPPRLRPPTSPPRLPRSTAMASSVRRRTTPCCL
jgi:hypothetical protein